VADPDSIDAAVKRTRCVLFAYHDTGYAFMEALLTLGAPIVALFTHQDDPHEEIWWRSCADLARRHSIPVFNPDHVDAAVTAQVVALSPEVIYSVYYRYLLPDAILNAATIGAFNLHGSLLPKYRGRAPVNWMIVNGEREAGLTLHYMVARADAGDIVAQRSCAIDDSDTALTLYRKLVPLGAEIIREYHPLIVSGSAPRAKQNLSRGSYFGRRGPADGRIDWRWPARRIFNLVRAVTHPYPGAFCYAAGEKIFVWEAAIANEDGMIGAPGEIIGEKNDGLEIAAGQGSLVVKHAQFEDGIEGDARTILGDDSARPRALL
jgi:UDP-4-amino-4-deoxy-L-arabinose formyltransferase/UDP-glucuronic acid dehydrogenase (UDP-4-keto-hexauronic acid decarboxylating)